MGSVHRYLPSPYLRDHPIDAAVIPVLRKYRGGVRYRMPAQQPGIVAVKRVVFQSPFAQRGHYPVAEPYTVIVAHLAEGHEIRPEPLDLVHYRVISSGNHSSLLPDIPLQYSKFRAFLRTRAQHHRKARQNYQNLSHFKSFFQPANIEQLPALFP